MMNSRRKFLKTTSCGLMGVLMGNTLAHNASAANVASGKARYLMPNEDLPHVGTTMAFASGSEKIWTPVSAETTHAGIVRVQQDLIDVAKAIGTFEPVTMLVRNADDLMIAKNLLANPTRANPTVHGNYLKRGQGVGGVTLLLSIDGFDDFWLRDSGAIFVKDRENNNQLCAINFHFNGWGNGNTNRTDIAELANSNHSKAGKYYQPFANDQKIAAWMASQNNATLIDSSLTLEGGALEVDGAGTAILTESSILHVNRNAHLFDLTNGVAKATILPTAKATVLAELNRTLGIQKIIWIPGTAVYPAGCGAGAKNGARSPDDETDITNGHADFYAKFLAPGVVAYALDSTDSTGELAITEANLSSLQGQTDANGKTLKLIPLVVPARFGSSAGTKLNHAQKSNFAAGYINFYACNGAVIMPKFNDPHADRAAITALKPFIKDRAVVQVDILGIASGGGGIHCVTMHIPA